MLVDTLAKMRKRQDEFDNEAIARLIRLGRKKGKGSWPYIALQTKYDLDLDFDNRDWGEEREHE